MSLQSIKIVQEAGIDVSQLIEVLNKAYADEFLAWYSYYSVVGISNGLFRKEIEDEFAKHAEEELKHAEMLKKRIIELGGTPLLNPQDWIKFSNCGIVIPQSFETNKLIQINLNAERCAIKVYNGIMEATKGMDPITFKLARNIMEEEIEHEQDLEDMEQDILKTLSIITSTSNDLILNNNETYKIENKVN